MIKVELEKQKHEKGRYRAKKNRASRQIVTRFVYDDFKKIEAYCKANEMTLSELIRESVNDYLTRQLEASESN